MKNKRQRENVWAGALRETRILARRMMLWHYLDLALLDDVVQETMIRVFETLSPKTKRSAKKLKSYVSWSIRSQLKHVVNQFCEIRDRVEIGYPIQGNVDMDTEITRAELLTACFRAVSCLDEEERLVVRLRFGLGGDGRILKLKEISSLLRCDQEEVGKIVSRGLRKLRHPDHSRKLYDFTFPDGRLRPEPKVQEMTIWTTEGEAMISARDFRHWHLRW